MIYLLVEGVQFVKKKKSATSVEGSKVGREKPRWAPCLSGSPSLLAPT